MTDEYNRPPWLDTVSRGRHACFFYTTEEEFLSIASPFLEEGLTYRKERTLWILPPNLSFPRARDLLAGKFEPLLDSHLKRRRLLLYPWEKWYGMEQAIQELLRRTEQILKGALSEGYAGLRVLSHSPHRTSSYWKDFFLYEESVLKRFKLKPFVSLCAYSLMDCPAQAISSIALNHSLCLIHRGSEWEWVENRQGRSILTL